MHREVKNCPFEAKGQYLFFAIAVFLVAMVGICLLGAPRAAYAETGFVVDSSAKTGAIYDVDGLKQFRDNVNKGTNYAGYTITLEDDISLSGESPWTPIGNTTAWDASSNYSFRGTFDGKRHTVSGMTCKSDKNQDIRLGLFGSTFSACVKNVYLLNPTITISAENKTNVGAGALIGAAGNTSVIGCQAIGPKIIDYCSVTPSDLRAIGGLAGSFVAQNNTLVGGVKPGLYDCSVVGADISNAASVTSASWKVCAGGIVGWYRAINNEADSSIASRFQRCFFDGSVKSNGFVGPFSSGIFATNTSTSANSKKLAALTSCFYSKQSTISKPNDDDPAQDASGKLNDYTAIYQVVNGKALYRPDAKNASGSTEAPVRVSSSADVSTAKTILGGDWVIDSSLYDHQVLMFDFSSVILTGEPASRHGYVKLSYKATGLSQPKSVEWSCDGGEPSGRDFLVPVSSDYLTVTLKANYADRSKTYEYTIPAYSPAVTVKATRTGADTKQLQAAFSPDEAYSAAVLEAADFTFEWYAIENGKRTLAGTGPTFDVQRGGAPEYQLVAQWNNGRVKATESAFPFMVVVYADRDKGNDANDGLTPTTAKKTIAGAYATPVLKSAADDGIAEEQAICVMSLFPQAEFDVSNSKLFNKPVQITSYIPGMTEDYRKAGACFRLCGSSNVGSIGLYEATVFKNFTFNGKEGEAYRPDGYVYCQGNDLTMDEGVRVEGYANCAPGTHGLITDSVSNDFHIVGGFLDYNKDPEKWNEGLAKWFKKDGSLDPNAACHITVKNGSFSRIIAGNRKSSNVLQDVSHHKMGSEENPFRVVVDVDMKDGSRLGETSVVEGKTYNSDIAMVCGGQTDSTVYCESTVTVKNATVPLVLGASIGYPRTAPGHDTDPELYPNNDYIGTSKVTIGKGAKVAQVFGGCLGRSQDNQFVSDARFRSFKKTGSKPSIVVNVEDGAYIGKIAGPTPSLVGLFAAGAGGAAGAYDFDKDKKTNTVNIETNITGGVIDGDVFGGGYGQSPAVYPGSQDATVNPEAGNVYGNCTLNIIGGEINSNVYGAGAGTIAYLAKNPNANNLAQVFGDVRVSVSGNVKVSKSVYGGARGCTRAGNDCSDMARIHGNCTLTVDGVSVGGSVFGGSAVGAIDGTVSTKVNTKATKSVSVGGSVYAGGEGVLLTGADLKPERQEDIGKVGKSTALEMKKVSVAGDVYGGGKIGAVLGSKSTMAATTTLQNCSVSGSVYGGGKGALAGTVPSGFSKKDVQYLLGQVGGNATLTLSDTNVDGDVYGGGSMGAVLGNATTKISGKDTVTVGRSLYGAGQGAQVSDDERTNLELQRYVGWVKGDVSLTATNVQVGENVYGGGNMGAVGNGIYANGSFSNTKAAKVKTVLDNITVGSKSGSSGSVFGGGMGNSDAPGNLPKMLGAVFGGTELYLYEGTVRGDVFGGGNRGYVYASASKNSNVSATKVVVNSNGEIREGSDGKPVDDGTLVDASAGSDTRSISLNGSVFGGGNISRTSSVVATETLVFGDTHVYLKGAGVTFANSKKGGIYGDGNLSIASGKRYVSLIDLKKASDSIKKFYSLQRADRAVVSNCAIKLLGAADLVNEQDTTKYSLNRVNQLRMYDNSTIEFDTVVNGLGKLWSDVLTDRNFTSEGDITSFGDNVTDDEKAALRAFVSGGSDSWTDADGTVHGKANTIVVNNGKWLDVKTPEDERKIEYGYVTGLFALKSSNASAGGAFVYGKGNDDADSTGTFVSLNDADGEPLDLYTAKTKFDYSTLDEKISKPCRVWYIVSNVYDIERDVKAYTSSAGTIVHFNLPITAADECLLEMKAADSLSISSSLQDMVKKKNGSGRYSLSLTAGEDAGATLPLVTNHGDWSQSFSGIDTVGLVPVSVKLDIPASQDELEEQSGTVSFTLQSSNGAKYRIKLNVEITKPHATAETRVHYGSVYNGIAMNQSNAIARDGVYTTEFITVYCPDAYKGRITPYLKARLTKDRQDAPSGKVSASQSSIFPKGTQITMVDLSNPSLPAYYYYECIKDETTIPVTSFVDMVDGSNYQVRTGNNVITEDLSFIIDYEKVSGGRSGSSTFAALEYLYDGATKDILRYEYTSEDGASVSHWDPLWSEYPISSLKTADALSIESLNKDAAGNATLKKSETNNFQYDTYTAEYRVTEKAKTDYSEHDATLAFWLGTPTKDGPLATMPLGSYITVANKETGDTYPTRYCYVQAKDDQPERAYVMVELKEELAGDYVVTLQMPRYLYGTSTLARVFGGKQATYQLHALASFSSEQGYFDAAANAPRATTDILFTQCWSNETYSAANGGTIEPSTTPKYEVKNGFDIKVNGGKATATISAAASTVLPTETTLAGGKGVRLYRVNPAKQRESVTASVTYDAANARYAISDDVSKLPAGDYTYQLYYGNTMYTKTVTIG